MRILVSSESGATSADALKLHLALLEESSSSIDAAVVAVASEAELKGLGDYLKSRTPAAASIVGLQITSSGPVIWNANAVAYSLVVKDDSPLSALDRAHIFSWLEYEETKVKPAITSGVDINLLLQILARLESHLSSSSTLSSKSSLPDLILAASLAPLFSIGSHKHRDAAITALPKTALWFDAIFKSELMVNALKSLKAGAKSVGAAPIGESKYKKEVARILTHHEKVVMPVANEKNILITSALPYVNNVPHLGNIIGCVLSADVYARYCRLQGYNTMFVCGTDEYGTATETKALEEGLSCQAICDKYHAVHKMCYEWFDVDFDHFGRTTTSHQTDIAQDIFHKADKNGYTMEDTVTQLYCETHKSFLADRFVEGTCPLCGYEDARGDQCDKCGKLLNATDLVKPHCKLDNATPIVKNSRHIFLDLPKLQKACEDFNQKSHAEGKWSANGIQITNSWIKEGLKPRCITRDLKWGTPVPKAGFEDKVFYVWFDAPIGYPSITASYTKDWEKWWKNPDQVKLYQFMGKDNVPFHSVIFPCSLIATGEPWTLVNHISTTEYLQYEGTKFSKSRGVGVFGNNVMDSGIPVDVWRYYLLSVRPESNDSQFSWDSFITANNTELLANLGNFVNRIVKFLGAKYDSIVPEPTLTDKNPMDEAMIKDINKLLSQYVGDLEAVKLRDGLKTAMLISSRGNQYLQENKIDNSLFANSRARCDTVVYHALNITYLLSSLFYPYIPSASASILRQLNLPLRRLEQWRNEEVATWWNATDLVPGHCIGKPEYLFKMIEEKKAGFMRAKYGGTQAENAAVAAAAGGAKPAVVGAVDGKKSSSKRGGAASRAPVLLSEVPVGVAKTPEMEDLETGIKSQGELVRTLKTDKAEPAKVKEAVDKLMELKKKLTDLVQK